MGLWDTITGAFGRDGAVTRFTEKVPVVGLVTAAVQAASGNTEHAKRALASNAHALITTSGAVAGFIAAGPPGAVAAGLSSSRVGLIAEWAVSKTINDNEVKGNTGEGLRAQLHQLVTNLSPTAIKRKTILFAVSPSLQEELTDFDFAYEDLKKTVHMKLYTARKGKTLQEATIERIETRCQEGEERIMELKDQFDWYLEKISEMQAEVDTAIAADAYFIPEEQIESVVYE